MPRGACHGTRTGSDICPDPDGELDSELEGALNGAKRKKIDSPSGSHASGSRTRLRVYTSVRLRPISRPSSSYAATSPRNGAPSVSKRNVTDGEAPAETDNNSARSDGEAASGAYAPGTRIVTRAVFPPVDSSGNQSARIYWRGADAISKNAA